MENPPTIVDSDAKLLALPPHSPKPTSIDGQTETSTTIWESFDGHVETGVWECTTGTFTAFRDGYDEIAHIVSGSATVTSSDGVVVEIGPGSILVTPSGWRGTWTVHDTVRKVYVTRTLP